MQGGKTIAIKKVHGFKYYWNVKKQQWEGLLSNAKPTERPMTNYQWKKYFDRLAKEPFKP